MKYGKLETFETYRLAVELSDEAWTIYDKLDWRIQKTMGDQFIRSADSVGANIAEAYGLYHYLNKVRHFYIARGSLKESCTFWLDRLYSRGFIKEPDFKRLTAKANQIEYYINQSIKKLRTENRNKA